MLAASEDVLAKERSRRIAALVETSNVYGREIQLGIANYLRSRPQWSVFVEQHELGAMPPPWLLQQRWDGIISRPTNARLARAFRQLRVPVVDLNDQHIDLGFPRLQSNNHAIGRLAAEHFRNRGFTRFAYCSFKNERWAYERREGYLMALAEAEYTVDQYETPWRGAGVLSWAAEQRRLTRWLARLPKPIAILACNDVRGRHVQETCRALGIAVPDEVAVLGVDNDELLCQMSSPPMSSVVPDAYRIGFEAASLLDRLMSGKAPREAVQFIPPRSVVTRQSTDVLAVGDDDVAAALRTIHARACRGLRVGDVLKVVPLSRSVLDRRFKLLIGRSPQEEIRRVQLLRAAQLLRDSSLPLKRIAKESGFAYMEYLSYRFKRAFGLSPRAYRRQHKR